MYVLGVEMWAQSNIKGTSSETWYTWWWYTCGGLREASKIQNNRWILKGRTRWWWCCGGWRARGTVQKEVHDVWAMVQVMVLAKANIEVVFNSSKMGFWVVLPLEQWTISDENYKKWAHLHFSLESKLWSYMDTLKFKWERVQSCNCIYLWQLNLCFATVSMQKWLIYENLSEIRFYFFYIKPE